MYEKYVRALQELILCIEIIQHNKAVCRLSKHNTMLKIKGISEETYLEVMKGVKEWLKEY